MRWLINYLRSCFCAHDWEQVVVNRKFEDDRQSRPYKITYLYRCKKCGYTQKIVIK